MAAQPAPRGKPPALALERIRKSFSAVRARPAQTHQV